VVDDRCSLECVNRLTGARYTDTWMKPTRGEPNSALCELKTFDCSQISPTHIAAADLDSVPFEMLAKRFGRDIVGLLCDHNTLGNHETAEIVTSERELKMVKAGFSQPFHGNPDTVGPIAVSEATQNSLHAGATDVLIR
jgi:hypothetical protein